MSVKEVKRCLDRLAKQRWLPVCHRVLLVICKAVVLGVDLLGGVGHLSPAGAVGV